MSRDQNKEAEDLSKKLRKLYPLIAISLIVITAVLMYFGLNPWLSVIIAMIITLIPVFLVGKKIDKMIGLTNFGTKTKIPRRELIIMLLIGIVNLLIFIFAFVTNNMTYRLIFLLIGLIFFLTLTIAQGRKISRLNSEIYKKNMNLNQQNTYDKIQETLENTSSIFKNKQK